MPNGYGNDVRHELVVAIAVGTPFSEQLRRMRTVPESQAHNTIASAVFHVFDAFPCNDLLCTFGDN